MNERKLERIIGWSGLREKGQKVVKQAIRAAAIPALALAGSLVSSDESSKINVSYAQPRDGQAQGSNQQSEEPWFSLQEAPDNQWFLSKTPDGRFFSRAVEFYKFDQTGVSYAHEPGREGIFFIQTQPGVSDFYLHLRVNPAFIGDYKQGDQNWYALYLNNLGPEAVVQLVDPSGRELRCNNFITHGGNVVQKLVNNSGDLAFRMPEYATYFGVRVIRGPSDVGNMRANRFAIGPLRAGDGEKMPFFEPTACFADQSVLPPNPSRPFAVDRHLLRYLSLRRMDIAQLQQFPNAISWLRTSSGQLWDKGVAFAANPLPNLAFYDRGEKGIFYAQANAGVDRFNLNLVTYPDEAWYFGGGHSPSVVWLDGMEGDWLKLYQGSGPEAFCVWGDKNFARPIEMRVDARKTIALFLPGHHAHFFWSIFKNPGLKHDYKISFGSGRPEDLAKFQSVDAGHCIEEIKN